MAAFVGTADRSQTVGREMTIQVGAATRLATWENEGGRSAPTAPPDEGLDWAGFLTRFYPHARKHDYVPLAAYVEFRKTVAPALPVASTTQPSERSRP
jgi:hypothetical protein